MLDLANADGWAVGGELVGSDMVYLAELTMVIVAVCVFGVSLWMNIARTLRQADSHRQFARVAVTSVSYSVILCVLLAAVLVVFFSSLLGEGFGDFIRANASRIVVTLIGYFLILPGILGLLQASRVVQNERRRNIE